MPARPAPSISHLGARRARAARAVAGSAGRRGATPTRLVALALVTVLAATGCYRNPDPRSWDDANAKTNFILGCTKTVSAKNGTTTSVAIADKSTCECIYNLIKMPTDGKQGTYAIKWDDLKAYEDKQASAKPGERPTPPKNLTKAVAKCQPAGPAA